MSEMNISETPPGETVQGVQVRAKEAETTAYDGSGINLAALANPDAPKTITQVTNHAADLDSKIKAFEQRLGMLVGDFERASVEANEQVERMQTLPPEEKPKHIEAEFAARKREILDKTDDERWGKLRELIAERDRILAMEELFKSPQHILSAAGVGSPERNRFEGNLAGAGWSTVRSFMLRAVANNDPVMGAACLSAFDSLNPQDKERVGISRTAFANVLVGEAYQKAANAFKVVRLRIDEAVNFNKRLEDRRVPMQDAIRLALDKRSIKPLEKN